MTSLAMWVVYKNPSDYPDKYVARRFDGLEPSASIIIAETLDGLREVLAFQLHLTCLARNPEDDSVIVETWL